MTRTPAHQEELSEEDETYREVSLFDFSKMGWGGAGNPISADLPLEFQDPHLGTNRQFAFFWVFPTFFGK